MTATQTKAVLQTVVGSGVAVFDYAAATDFNELWRPGFSAEQVVVLYSHTPGDARVEPVNTAQFLSPLVWGICARSTLKLRRLAILNLTDGHGATSGLDPCFGLLRHDALPWLRIVSLRDFVLGLSSVDESLGLGGDLPSETVDHAAVATLLDVLRHRLTDSFEPDVRHAISNLVGPFLLLGRQPTSVALVSNAKADHLSALRRVLSSCGLLSTDMKSTSGTEHPRVALPAGSRLFILDDQWRHGWGEWVCTQIEGVTFARPATVESGWTRISSPESAVTVLAAADPTHLLGDATTPGPLRPVEGQRDKRFALSLHEELAATDILLLDLRLFAGDDTRERDWTRRLLDVCRHFEGRDHAWPGFDQEELKAIEGWCHGSGGDRDRGQQTAVAARALLGRLLAMTDLSLPIILFSSTTDTDLVERFKDYGNVITTFHKPRTFGASAHDDRKHFADRFVEAMGQAMVLLDARQFVHQVQDWAAQGHQMAWRLAGVSEGGSVPWKHAELYVDEGGDPVKLAGGYIMLYADPDDHPRALAAQFTDQWGTGREDPTKTTGFIPKAKDLYSQHGQAGAKRLLAARNAQLRRATSTTGVGLAACVVQGRDLQGTVTLGPDENYITLASHVLELFLCVWLPALREVWKAEAATTCGVFLGTRMWSPDDVSQLIKHQWRFGTPLRAFAKAQRTGQVSSYVAPSYSLPSVEGEVGYARMPGDRAKENAIRVDAGGAYTLGGRTMAPSAAQALVVNVLRERAPEQAQGLAKRITCAVAVQLTYEHNNLVCPPELPRQVHYASDDLLSDADAASQELEIGFHVSLSANLARLLRASRAFDDHPPRIGDGLRHFREACANRQEGAAPLRHLPLWASVRCVPLLSELKGSDFVHFAASKSTSSALLLQASRASQQTRPAPVVAQSWGGNPKPSKDQPRRAGPASQSPPATRQPGTLTREVAERLLRQHVPTLVKELSVKSIFSDPNWCVVALHGRGGIIADLPSLSPDDVKAGVRAFGCNWKAIFWSDDPVVLASRILGQNGGDARYDDGGIAVGSNVSDIKIRAIGELTQKIVRRQPQG